MVISIKIWNFSRSRMTVEIVSQNLATTSNFVEFRDSQNFTYFEAPGVECCMIACERYT